MLKRLRSRIKFKYSGTLVGVFLTSDLEVSKENTWVCFPELLIFFRFSSIYTVINLFMAAVSHTLFHVRDSGMEKNVYYLRVKNP